VLLALKLATALDVAVDKLFRHSPQLGAVLNPSTASG
jgi:hypothetical protein